MAYLPPQSSLFASEPLAKGIQDNSFFIEEAYNQEPGVVQHIFNLPDLKSTRLTVLPLSAHRRVPYSLPSRWPKGSRTTLFSSKKRTIRSRALFSTYSIS